MVKSKKFTAALLSIVMVFTLTASVFAAPSYKHLEYNVAEAENIPQEELDNLIPVVLKAFQDALADAKTVLEAAKAGTATQEEIDAANKALYDAMQYLEFTKGDKTKLIALVEEIVNAAIEAAKDSYTEESYEPFQAALAEARKVILDENAMQKEIDDTYNALYAAREALVLKPIPEVDKSALEKIIKEVEDSKYTDYKDFYTEASYNALTEALAKAKEVYENVNATQSVVDAATKELTDAFAALTVDKTLLKNLVEKIDKNFEDNQYDGYTQETVNALKKALEEAEVVLKNDVASAAEVKEAYEKLQAAEAALKVDKSGLQAVVDRAHENGYNDKENLYTKDSYKNYQDAYKYALEILAKEDATVTEVRNATKGLEDAIIGLKLKSGEDPSEPSEDPSEPSENPSGSSEDPGSGSSGGSDSGGGSGSGSKSSSGSKTKSPKTSDGTPITLMLLSITMAVLTVVILKKKSVK